MPTPKRSRAANIPALAQVPSDLLAIAVVTVNGDILTAGSADTPFAIESISKAFNLAYVMDLIGMKELRTKIGADPTGEPFNSVMAIELHGGKPLNPLVNAGAMATVSLVNGSDSDEIWSNMIHNFNNFANTALTVNQEIYKSESATNQHNRGIAWLLDSYGYFYNTPPMIVDLYTRMCSLNITTSQLALMGACYANGGVNPVSKKRVVKDENVPAILAELCMSGLYNSTGDWMYKAGVPAKSGVGGGLVLNGKSITGHSYITGEFGHIRLPVDALEVVGRDFPLLRCGCGQLGCIENYLSGRGFAWLYEHFYQQPLSSPEIVAQWQQHDPRAQAHVERYLDLLAVCLGNILTIVDPDLLVLGGGLSNFTAISEGVAQRLPRHLLPVARVPRIERARHGDAGGMRGAAFLHLTH